MPRAPRRFSSQLNRSKASGVGSAARKFALPPNTYTVHVAYMEEYNTERGECPVAVVLPRIYKGTFFARSIRANARRLTGDKRCVNAWDRACNRSDRRWLVSMGSKKKLEARALTAGGSTPPHLALRLFSIGLSPRQCPQWPITNLRIHLARSYTCNAYFGTAGAKWNS